MQDYRKRKKTQLKVFLSNLKKVKYIDLTFLQLDLV